MLQSAFLDLERERPHFIIERRAVLVLVSVIDVLEELPMMAWRQHEHARLHDMRAASRQAPKAVPFRWIQCRPKDRYDFGLVAVSGHEPMPKRPVLLDCRKHGFVD